MHDVLSMHDLQTFKDTFHNHFNFSRLEFMPAFDFVTKLSSFQHFHTHIDRILRLEDTIQLHQVFMIEFPHYFYFVYQGFFSFFFTECSFLWKGFYCVFFVVFVADYKINWGKISFANLLDRFEKLMKTSLVEVFLKKVSPGQNLIFITFSF